MAEQCNRHIVANYVCVLEDGHEYRCKSNLDTCIERLTAELKASRDIQSAEKQIVITEVSKNQQLLATIVELRKGLDKAKTFITYARYELTQDTHQAFEQFPCKECCDKELIRIDTLLQSPNPGEGLLKELAELREKLGYAEAYYKAQLLTSNELMDDIQRLTSELAAAREAISGWQPIETAPKDGKTVFIWYAGECVPAAYLSEHHGRIPNWHLLDNWRNWGPVSDPPKYWMPLPSPPEAIAAAEERK